MRHSEKILGSCDPEDPRKALTHPLHHGTQKYRHINHLACGHEEGEEEDEGALGHWQPVSLLHGEEDGSVQTGFGRAADIEVI